MAAYLWSRSDAAELDRPAAGQADSGKRLAERLGCLACHQIGGAGQDSLFGAFDEYELAQVREELSLRRTSLMRKLAPANAATLDPPNSFSSCGRNGPRS